MLAIDRIALEREACKRSLLTFVREAWPILEPSQPFVEGWHVGAICEHLEAITTGEITRLLLNIPPGTMKSSLAGIYWPAWEWGPRGQPSMRFIGASHEQDLAIRDARKMRELVASDWYQTRWPLLMQGDQNQKKFYQNSETGFRVACAVKSMTGRRGDRVLWDDPHNVEGALSEVDRETAARVFKETLPTRMSNPDSSAILIAMQRLHERDISGVILEAADHFGYDHLMLPMEFEPDRRCVTSIGWEDPRTEEGELLFPQRFSREVVERDKTIMGTYATAGQFQQRPTPRTGGFFAWEKLTKVGAAPHLVRLVRYWDKAGTQDGGKRTAGVLMGRCRDGHFYVLDVVTGQWNAGKREAIIRATAEMDGPRVTVWIEQEPGSGGKESAEATIENLAGFVIKAERPQGEKELRAEPYSVQVEAGNVYIVDGEWNELFIKEHQSFPRGKFKDQIDAAAGAFNKLARPSKRGVL